MKGKGLEPYRGRDLCRRLEAEGAKLRRQSGSHRYYEMPDGRQVGATESDRVDGGLARRVATELGMPFPAFRVWIGHPLTRHGRSSKAPSKAKRPVVCRADVMAALGDLDRVLASVRRQADSLRSEFASGDRDESAYRAALQRISVLARAIKGATEAAL